MHGLSAFVAAARDPDPVISRRRLFEALQAFPYRTDAAHDAEALLALGAGDCLAKADLAVEAFTELGYAVRKVRWRYELPASPAEVHLLPTGADIHTAAEILIDSRWTLVDATIDPPLKKLGFVVPTWDGIANTVPAFEPTGPRWYPGPDDSSISLATRELDSAWRATPVAVGESYRAAFNRWLDSARA